MTLFEKASPLKMDFSKTLPAKDSPRTPSFDISIKALPAMQMNIPVITKPSLLAFLPAYAAVTKDLATKTSTGPIVGQFIRQEPIVLPNYSHSWGYKLPKTTESFQFSHPFPGVVIGEAPVASISTNPEDQKNKTVVSAGNGNTSFADALKVPVVVPVTDTSTVPIVVCESSDESTNQDLEPNCSDKVPKVTASDSVEIGASVAEGVEKSGVTLVPVQELLSPVHHSPSVIKEGAIILCPPEAGGAPTPQQQIVYFIGDSQVQVLGVEKEGPHACDVCSKSFPQQHQLTLHRNIHFMDKPFRCSVCSMYFKNQGMLERHEKSESHIAKHELRSQQEAAIKDDPRPYKCSFCNVAFRIRGHLSKHLRSKLHVTTLEKMDMLPAGTFDRLDKSGEIARVDTSDPQSVLKILQGKGGGDGSDYVHSPRPSTSKDTEDEEEDGEDEGELMIDESLVEDGNQERRESMASPIKDHFHLNKVADYEKHDQASNERVTVEIKQEPLDIFEIGQGNSDAQRYGTETESEKFANVEAVNVVTKEGRTSPGVSEAAHKCGICRQNFRSLDQLRVSCHYSACCKHVTPC